MRIAWEHRKAIKTIEVLVAFLVFQCRKRQCYDARYEKFYKIREEYFSFNAASGNAMMQVSMFLVGKESVMVFQCRKRQCYDASYVTSVDGFCDFKFQCRKRQCYDASGNDVEFKVTDLGCFNAASGNAMMQAFTESHDHRTY